MAIIVFLLFYVDKILLLFPKKWLTYNTVDLHIPIARSALSGQAN